MPGTLIILAPGLGVSQLKDVYKALKALECTHPIFAWNWWGIEIPADQTIKLATVLDDNILALHPDRIGIVAHSFGAIPAFDTCATRPDVTLFQCDPVSCVPFVSKYDWPSKTKGIHFKASESEFGVVQLDIPNSPDYRVVAGGHNDIPHAAMVINPIVSWAETGIIPPV